MIRIAEKRIYLGYSVPPPHLEFALLATRLKCVESKVTFRSRSFTKTFQGFVVDVAQVHKCRMSVVLFDLHLE